MQYNVQFNTNKQKFEKKQNTTSMNYYSAQQI